MRSDPTGKRSFARWPAPRHARGGTAEGEMGRGEVRFGGVLRRGARAKARGAGKSAAAASAGSDDARRAAGSRESNEKRVVDTL